jgi:copper chaperone NosL
MNKLSPLSRILFFTGSVLLFFVLVFPIWRIELDAPQYPEGLKLTIHAHKLGGDVDVVNGLNHYIGMATLHAEEFVEFKVLPYIIGGFGVLGLLFAFLNRKRWLYIWLGLFFTFAVLAMVDFWRWEYEYGHNLDPTAPIQVPGMSYQPPLIGFKQLLNFGAYSVPDIGGWIMISSGLLVLVAVVISIRKKS